MPSAERSFDRAVRRAEPIRRELGSEIRAARLSSGTSQAAIAAAARLSQSAVSRIEEGKLVALTIAQAIVVADAVGLDVSVKAYPGRRPTRDAGHTRKMTAFLAHVARPVRFATEVALPPREAARERRAWDAMLFAPDGDTGVELEMRLYDMQAQTRRLFLKWRDSGVERLLLLVDDSRTNRHALALFPEYLNGLPRIRTAMLYAALERGERPPSAYALI